MARKRSAPPPTDHPLLSRTMSRQSFLRGLGATVAAGAGALMFPAAAGAAVRPSEQRSAKPEPSGSNSSMSRASASSGDAPTACFETCYPSNCGSTQPCRTGHYFHCVGCYDFYDCFNHICASFCYQTQPC